MGRPGLLAGLVMLCGAAARGLSAQAATEVRVPRAAPITVDARLAPGEWDDAAVVLLSDGTELRLQHDGRFLNLGFRVSTPGFPSVCVAGANDVRVLHASAALAQAVYARAGDGWTLRTPFEYALRTRDTTAAAREERAAYLRANGWLATTMYMGDRTQREMQLPLAYLGDAPRLAVAYLRDSPAVRGPSGVWPAHLADGCTAVQLVRGLRVVSPAFEPARWARLTIAR